MKSDLKKKLADFMGKIDSKILESKLNQVCEMINDGKHDEFIKKLKNVDQNELQEKMDEFANLKPEDLEMLKERMSSCLNEKELSDINDKLDLDGKKKLQKIISTLQIK